LTARVRLWEVDDALDASLRRRTPSPPELASDFPREEDLVALDGRERGALAFAIVADDVVVGTCGTHGRPSNKGEIELGWGLVSSARGRGVGSAAVASLLGEMTRRYPSAVLVARTEWVSSGAGAGVVADSPASETILARSTFTAEPAPTRAGERTWRRSAARG
jgi:RimJ/RimL family protein N-acetyltransferase